MFNHIRARYVIALGWGAISHLTDGDPQTPFNRACEKSDRLIAAFKESTGAPGISVCVCIGGKTSYSKGFGYADVEQGVYVTANTKFRIASISKAFTSILVGRMIDQGHLDLDADVKLYLPTFDPKTQDSKPASITMRQLMSHTSGVRGYQKAGEERKPDENSEEMLSTRAYSSAQEALSIFASDALLHAPGTAYAYTTHGYTLVASVLEAIAAETTFTHNNTATAVFSRSGELPVDAKWDALFRDLFAALGLRDTHLDEPKLVVPFRSRPYRRSKKTSRLENAPWVDNSCKWSGGGLLSTAPDLCRMANHLAEIYLATNPATAGVVSRDTLVGQLWRPVVGTSQGKWLPGGRYALGWFVARRSGVSTEETKLMTKTDWENSLHGEDRLLVGHTGGAIGFTSVLVLSLPLLPLCESNDDRGHHFSNESPPPLLPPITIAILTNLEDARGIGALGLNLAEIFTLALQESVANNGNHIARRTALAIAA